MYKLLVVDDNKSQLLCVLDYVDWASLGFTEIKTASNGSEGLELFTSFRPDLIITDILMPVLNGVDMTTRIRELDDNVSIVFMSCYEEFEYAKAAVDNGVCYYLLKPINADALNELVRNIVKKIEQKKQMADSARLSSSYLTLMKENMLYRLLYSEQQPEDFIDTVLNELGYAAYCEFVCIKFILPAPEEEQQSFRAMLDETFSDDFHLDMLIDNNKEFVLFLSSRLEDEHILLTKISNGIRNLMGDFRLKVDRSLIVGISSFSKDLRKASHLLYQATLALSAAKHQEHFKASFYQETVPDDQTLDLKHFQSKLEEILSLRNYDSIDMFLNNYMPQVASANDNRIKNFCFTTINALQLILQEYSGDFNEIFGSIDVIWHKLNNFRSILNVRQWMKNIIIACSEYVENKSSTNQNRHIVDVITEYINKNYGSIVSIEEVAKNLYISVGYAKKIFKQHTGQTIFDYLVETRIKEAKRLLSDPDIRVYEVGELVGYASIGHFTETFRKRVGMNPKEYQKEQILKRHIHEDRD